MSVLNSTEKSFCERVSSRKAMYESALATHQGLLDLGKTMEKRQRADSRRTEKHAYLLSAIKDLDGFDGNIFMTEYERTKDLNILKAKSYSLVRYIYIFKELHNYNIDQLQTLQSQVKELKSDVKDQAEEIDNYINQLDETDVIISEGEKKIKTLTRNLAKADSDIVNLKKSLEFQKRNAQINKFLFLVMLVIFLACAMW